MDVEVYITEQNKLVKKHLEDTFKISLVNLSKIDDFLNIMLQNILSLKVWLGKLKDNNIFSKIYLEEVISNLNQALVLAITGFKVPACVMIRRSMENIVSFLYYKDHPVEYFRKEFGTLSTSIKDLKEYFKKYPSELIPNLVDSGEFKKLLKKLIGKWSEFYKELSNYVHGSQREYLVLKTYLENISPRDKILLDLIPMAEGFGNMANALLIVFFFDVYSSMGEPEKSLIRLSIRDNEIKGYITNALGTF